MFNGFVQEYPLQWLHEHNVSVNYVSKEASVLFQDPDRFFRTYPQQIIKQDTNTYVFLNGTGRLYKTRQVSGRILFDRIDSTTHFGYNIASFPFVFQNHIYNIGGYGLWRMNGQLRIFNEKDKQWDIVKLNEEVPFLFDEVNDLLWYDNKKGKLYLGYSMVRNEAVGSNDIDETKLDFVSRVLDMQKHSWDTLGELSKQLVNKIQVITTIGMSPWGQLVTIGDKINLIDFKQNTVRLLKVDIPYYQSIFRNKFQKTVYFRDSTLYMGSNSQKTLDSIKMSINDFENTGEPVFVAIPQKNTQTGGKWVTITVLLISACSLALIFLKYYKISFYRRSDSSARQYQSISIPMITQGKIVFDEREIQILALLIANSEKGEFTTIDDINRILGITKRSFEIQKKQRSDIIMSINSKYAFLFPETTSIVQKRRTEFDKRSFEYYLEYGNIENAKNLVSSSKHK